VCWHAPYPEQKARLVTAAQEGDAHLVLGVDVALFHGSLKEAHGLVAVQAHSQSIVVAAASVVGQTRTHGSEMRGQHESVMRERESAYTARLLRAGG
jgi:ribonuclease HII